jgi:AraC-like DNA-binding protein
MLRAVRLTGSLQFCFMPSGNWETDAAPSLAGLAGGGPKPVPFHIVVEGECWLKIGSDTVTLKTGDVVAFPFATGHQLGAGEAGILVTPVADLPPRPWRSLPVMRYGEGQRVRLLCGFLRCDAVNFAPLRKALPPLIHVKAGHKADSAWLDMAISRVVAEVDFPRAGSLSMIERLTEIIFIEMLRQEIAAAETTAGGWLAALVDPNLSRSLALLHGDPHQDWSVDRLASAAGLSRSAFSERFERTIGTTPIRYLRDWRLCLASVELATSGKPIAEIAYEAGYGTEAAFNRAFARSQGTPPATWRAAAR